MRKGGLLAIVLILTAGCGSWVGDSPAPAITSPSPAVSDPLPSPPLSIAEQAFSCTLPVVKGRVGGFLTFPAGSFQADPESNASLPVADVSPGPSYDRVLSKWLPVPREWVSPDGTHYAYPASLPAGAGEGTTARPTGVHIVDAVTGADRLLSPSRAGLPPDAVWWVVAFGLDGVYLSAQPNGPTLPVGLWLMDAAGASLKKIRDSGTWSFVSGGSAYGTALGQLIRLNLTDASIATWYRQPAGDLIAVGMDAAGHPLIETVGTSPVQGWLVTSANQATAITAARGSSLPVLDPQRSVLEDSHGIWFGDSKGGSVSLYTPGAGLRRLAQLDAGPVRVVADCG